MHSFATFSPGLPNNVTATVLPDTKISGIPHRSGVQAVYIQCCTAGTLKVHWTHTPLRWGMAKVLPCIAGKSAQKEGTILPLSYQPLSERTGGRGKKIHWGARTGSLWCEGQRVAGKTEKGKKKTRREVTMTSVNYDHEGIFYNCFITHTFWHNHFASCSNYIPTNFLHWVQVEKLRKNGSSSWEFITEV